MRTFERGIIPFLKKHQIALVSILLALFSLHLALTDKRNGVRGSVMVKDALSDAVSPLQRLVIGTRDAVAGVWNDYIFLVGVKKENDALQNTIISLQAENDKLREDARLNDRLRDILKYKDETHFKIVTAGVIGFNIEGWTRTITLNRGAAEGIRKDMPVLSPVGVVGRIFDVREHSSLAILDTDPRSDIDVIAERSRVKGVAEGSGAGSIVLKYIRQADDVQVGDRILTSGLSVFPKGLVVGDVTSIEKKNDSLFKYIEVRPRVDFQSIEQVLVVTDAGVSRH